MSVQSIPNASFKPNPTSFFHPLSLSTKPKISFSPSSSLSSSNFSCSFRTNADSSLRISASSSSSNPLVFDEPSAHDSLDAYPSNQKKKLGVVVKPLHKPRLVLKFIWMQTEIGIALNQSIPGYGTIPLSPYYFWPRKDAWEQLKVLLENKPWISELHRIHLLNQATDLINLWQTSGGKLE